MKEAKRMIAKQLLILTITMMMLVVSIEKQH
jgi:hypothetical protein